MEIITQETINSFIDNLLYEGHHKTLNVKGRVYYYKLYLRMLKG
jgi:hypothetical protein